MKRQLRAIIGFLMKTRHPLSVILLDRVKVTVDREDITWMTIYVQPQLLYGLLSISELETLLESYFKYLNRCGEIDLPIWTYDFMFCYMEPFLVNQNEGEIS